MKARIPRRQRSCNAAAARGRFPSCNTSGLCPIKRISSWSSPCEILNRSVPSRHRGSMTSKAAWGRSNSCDLSRKSRKFAFRNAMKGIVEDKPPHRWRSRPSLDWLDHGYSRSPVSKPGRTNWRCDTWKGRTRELSVRTAASASPGRARLTCSSRDRRSPFIRNRYRSSGSRPRKPGGGGRQSGVISLRFCRLPLRLPYRGRR